MSNHSPKDKTKVDFNPLTGEFDLVREFNADRIVTHNMNSAGSSLVIFDPVSGKYLPLDPLIVTDNNGNVVVAG